MKKIIALFVSLVFMFCFAVSCMSANGGAYGVDGDVAGGNGGDVQGVAPGTITACAWNDNEYYDMWKNLFYRGQGSLNDSATESDVDSADKDGRLYKYLDDWGLNSLDRVKVTVKSGEIPLGNIKIRAYDMDGELLFTAKTDNAGEAFLFPQSEKGYLTVDGAEEKGEAKKIYFDDENRLFNVDIVSEAQKSDIIQIMFVIDATGSMGDEMEYLKTELGDVIKRVVEDNDCKIYLAFLFYRDDGDEEKFAYSDFSDVTDPENYEKSSKLLMSQKASGGGDYPEALDEAILTATEKQWIDGATKIIFHLYDAPAHDKEENKARFAKAVLSASEKGIRICPILASGANTLCEYLARQSAIYTGGTFVFITNESGIGYDHYDPMIENVVVEKLNELLIRLINGYKTGVFADPVWYNAGQKGESSEDGASVESDESFESAESCENTESADSGEKSKENAENV